MSDYNDKGDKKAMTYEEKVALLKNMEITYTSKQVASADEVAEEYLKSQAAEQSPLPQEDAGNQSNIIGAIAAVGAAGLSSDTIKSMAADELISKAAEQSPELQKALGVLDQVGIDLTDPSAISTAQVKENLQGMAADKLEAKLAENPKVKEAMGVLDNLGVDLQNPGDVDKELIKDNLQAMATEELTAKLTDKMPEAAEALGVAQGLGLGANVGGESAGVATTDALPTEALAENPGDMVKADKAPKAEKKPPREHEAMMALNRVNTLVLAKRQTIDLSLTYDDLEKTPAREVPYRLTFDNGEVREGTLDEKGQANESDIPNVGWELEYFPMEEEEEKTLEEELSATYKELDETLKLYTTDLINADLKTMANIVANQKPWPMRVQKYLQAMFENGAVQTQAAAMTKEELSLREIERIRRALKQHIEDDIARLKKEAEAFNNQAWYERFWEYTKSTGVGVGNAVVDYIPDFGEVGDLMKLMDLDTDLLLMAMTGDVTGLETEFKKWAKDHRAEFQEASESMEILILLLTDDQTRNLLLSVPKRYIEAMPADKVVEYSVAIGVQWVGDAAIVGGLTAAGTVVPGPGNAAGAATGLTITTLRKAGKAMEAITGVLMKLVKVIKTQRNRRKTSGSGSQSHDKTSLPQNDKRKGDEGDKSVRPTIDISQKESYKIAYIDSETKEHHHPAQITLGIAGPGKSSYRGKGKVKIVSGQAKLFEDKALTQQAKASYGSDKLKKGQVLYVKAEDLGSIAIEHSLSPDSGFKIGNPKKETVQVKPFKRIYLHAFTGARDNKSLAKFKDLVKQHELENSKGPDVDELLLYTGHVGVSFDKKKPIFGFNPDVGDEAGWEVLKNLKDFTITEPYPGIVTDDTSVFRKATGRKLNYKVLIYLYTEIEYQKVYKKFQSEKINTKYTYSFPRKGGDCNCATWPAKIGIPIPSNDGSMKVYITTFNHNQIIVVAGEKNENIN